MKQFAVLLLPVLVFGCAEPKNPTQVTADSTVTDSNEVTTVSFEAGDSATIEVPKMHCPIVCFPNVKDSLEEMDGVEMVELVPQKEEGKIDDRRVTVKFNGNVDASVALATLKENGFPESSFEN